MWPATGHGISIRDCLIQGQCSQSPDSRFTWHRWVLTESTDKGVALEIGTVEVEFPGECPSSGIHRGPTLRPLWIVWLDVTSTRDYGFHLWVFGK